MKDRIQINKDLIPYQFEIILGANMYTLGINYNDIADLFTITLYKDKELICTEPIIYNVPLFTDIYQYGNFPSLEIVPYDESGQEVEVTWENFGETVFLTIFDDGDSNG